jgi:response regulator of citrate/malate metabolism
VKCRVLIIDDVEEMRLLLREILQGIPGVTVSGLAQNTAEARLEIARRRPDLCLLDEILPGESSLDLLKELQTEGIPVILITGVSEPKHEIPAGAADRWVKPSWDNQDRDQRRIEAAMTRVLTKR